MTQAVRDAPAQASLLDLMEIRSQQTPDRVLYSFLIDGEDQTIDITCGVLACRTEAIAARLRSMAVEGDRVVVLLPDGPEFIFAWFACLRGGLLPVPAYPLQTGRASSTLPRLQSILADARPALVLTTEEMRQICEREDGGRHRCISLAELEAHADVASWRAPHPLDRIAALQYTSGSWAEPKGVMLTHQNLVENARNIQSAYGLSSESTGVGWIPLAHDYGLAAIVVLPLFLGARCAFMTPTSFIREPVRWLRAIARLGAVHSGGPNLGYELCLRHIDDAQTADLDLSCWAIANLGGEVARPRTLNAFAEKFGPRGFRRSAFGNGYGLAEATLLVSIARDPRVLALDRHGLTAGTAEVVDAQAESAFSVTSAGTPPANISVKIVDPESRQVCARQHTGEIWVSRAPSIAAGYWNRREESAATFHAYTSDTHEGPFLRTGDLGFLHDGELFVVDRVKDLIILNGRNHHPIDIEDTVQRADPRRFVVGAAFAIDMGGEERLMVVQEVDHLGSVDPMELIASIEEALTRQHGISPYAIALVRRGSIPVTSSGKPRRRACRDAYLEGQLDVLSAYVRDDMRIAPEQMTPPETPTERKLAAIWLDVLGLDQIGTQFTFFELGGDSVRATACAGRVRDSFGLELPVALLFERTTTLGRLAELIDQAARGRRRRFLRRGTVVIGENVHAEA